MTKRLAVSIFIACAIQAAVYGQPENIRNIFPNGTVFIQNIPYAADTLRKHLLDVYLPAKPIENAPLIVWVHGGAWMLNDKYADMGYMTTTVKTIIEKRFVLASIDYRHSTQQIFPAQIQDCNRAMQYLHDHATTYKFDPNKIILMGFSAGGHLASLLALSNNKDVPQFYHDEKKPNFKIKGVVDFYGPSQFLLFFGNATLDEPNNDPISTLIGDSPLKRPDLSDLASPVTYVDKNDPPFFIVHGEKDQDVPLAQSLLLQSCLKIAGVQSELTIVKDAPHFGPMFDTEEVRVKLFQFLEQLTR